MRISEILDAIHLEIETIIELKEINKFLRKLEKGV